MELNLQKDNKSLHHSFLMAIFYGVTAANLTLIVNVGPSINSTYFGCSLIWLFQGFLLWSFAERSNLILKTIKKEKEKFLQETQKLEETLSLEEVETSREISIYRTLHRNLRSFNNFTQKLWGKMVLSTFIAVFLTLTGFFTHYLYQTNISFSLAKIILYVSIFLSLTFNFSGFISNFLSDLISSIKVKLLPLGDSVRILKARRELNKLKRKARKKYKTSTP